MIDVLDSDRIYQTAAQKSLEELRQECGGSNTELYEIDIYTEEV
jgi:hypothetical protein